MIVVCPENGLPVVCPESGLPEGCVQTPAETYVALRARTGFVRSFRQHENYGVCTPSQTLTTRRLTANYLRGTPLTPATEGFTARQFYDLQLATARRYPLVTRWGSVLYEHKMIAGTDVRMIARVWREAGAGGGVTRLEGETALWRMVPYLDDGTAGVAWTGWWWDCAGGASSFSRCCADSNQCRLVASAVAYQHDPKALFDPVPGTINWGRCFSVSGAGCIDALGPLGDPVTVYGVNACRDRSAAYSFVPATLRVSAQLPIALTDGQMQAWGAGTFNPFTDSQYFAGWTIATEIEGGDDWYTSCTLSNAELMTETCYHDTGPIPMLGIQGGTAWSASGALTVMRTETRAGGTDPACLNYEPNPGTVQTTPDTLQFYLRCMTPLATG